MRPAGIVVSRSPTPGVPKPSVYLAPGLATNLEVDGALGERDRARDNRRTLDAIALAHSPATLCIARIALNAADLRMCSG